MPVEADSQKVPVNGDGGLSVSEEQAMSEKVRAAKERYRQAQPVHPYEPNPLGKNQLSYIVEQINAADAAADSPQRAQVPDGPIAPVRRKGPAPRPLPKHGDVLANGQVIVDETLPRGTILAGYEPPAADPEHQEVDKARKTARADAKRQRQLEEITDEDLLAEAGVVPFYSTVEAAQFFDRTTQWMYWGLGRDDTPVFVYPDGSPILPERVGDPKTGRRRFTLPVIKDILLSSYRRGNIEPDELKKILRRIRINELGGEWRDREGWHKIRGKWVHPDECAKVGGVWVRRKKEESEQ